MSETPKRIQRKRTRGWKMPPNTIYVGRPGRFGNPFHIGKDGTQKECVAFHEGWLLGTISDADLRSRFIQINADWLINMRKLRQEAVRELRDKNLCCWCPLGQPCHADVLLELANLPTSRDVR